MPLSWKDALPFLGAAATGGVPALVAAAASAISSALGTEVLPTKDGIDEALRKATPEQLVALKQVDASFKIRMRELDTEDRKIVAATEDSYIKDVSDARKFNSETHGVLLLGYFINIFSYLCIAGVLYGCFVLLGGSRPNVDPGIAAMVGGIVGAAVQWIMGNAAQANGFFFGSSPSSRQTNSDLAKAVTNFSSTK